MRTRRLLAAVTLAGVAVTFQPAATLAAPAPFEGLRASCPGLGDTILTSPGNGQFTPGFIEGTNDVLVPYVIDLTISGPDGSTTLFAAKAAPVPEGGITCTLDVTFHSGGATYTIKGTVTGVVVGQP